MEVICVQTASAFAPIQGRLVVKAKNAAMQPTQFFTSLIFFFKNAKIFYVSLSTTIDNIIFLIKINFLQKWQHDKGFSAIRHARKPELSGTKNFVPNSIPNLKPMFLFRSVPKF